MSYESSYNSAKRRYSTACSEINNCQNKISELKNQRQEKIKQINQLETDIKNHQTAQADLDKIIRNSENMNQKVTDVTNKTSQASVNYSGMVSASDITSKDLNDVYGDEMSDTKRILNDIFEDLRAKMTALIAKITDLQNQLRRAQSDLEDINNKIDSTESDLQSWKRKKTSASNDVEYYRRKMREDD